MPADPFPRSAPLSAALLVLILCELGARALGSPLLQSVAWAATGLAVLLSLRRLGLREAYLLSLSLVLTGLVLRQADDPAAAIRSALDQAGFLLVFILLVGLLQEAAQTSPSVAAFGAWLTRQPPGRRYYALSGGTAALGVLFNLGTVSFLVPLIQKGIAAGTPGDALNPIRERRQISALLRGFAWCVVWSPTALAPLAVAQLIPGVQRWVWIGWGFLIFILLTLVGAAEDRWRFGHLRPAAPRPTPPFPARAALKFGATAGWLFGLVGLIVWLRGETVIFALLMAVPLVVAGWLAAQAQFPRPGWGRVVAGRLRGLIADLPRSARVGVTLACSGYIGRAAAALVPAAEVARTLGLDAMPDFVLLSLIPVTLALLSLAALSPIMMAVFFGSLFGALPVLPADPTLIALAISCGWGLAMTFSPFATIVLVIERAAGIPATTLTWKWNLVYTLLCALALVPVFWALTGGR